MPAITDLPTWLQEPVRRLPFLDTIRKAMWRGHLLIDWWGTKVWTRTKTVDCPLGFKFAAGVHPAYAQMRAGTFEPDETAIMSRVLPRADLFVDVGANLGYFTLLARKFGVPVIAIEPQPRNVQTLFANLAANGWTAEVFPVALAECPGALPLYGASGPSASLLPKWAGYSTRHVQTVPVSTLDTLLASQPAGKTLAVKIDVEGAELGVLNGAAQTLARFPDSYWLVEICLSEFHPDGANPDFLAIFETFFSRGFSAFVADRHLTPVDQADATRWAAQGKTDSGVFNYLFVGPGQTMP